MWRAKRGDAKPAVRTRPTPVIDDDKFDPTLVPCCTFVPLSFSAATLGALTADASEDEDGEGEGAVMAPRARDEGARLSRRTRGTGSAAAWYLAELRNV